MANQEHLDILRQGVEEWNRWRERYPDILPDLSGAKLNSVRLSNFRYSSTDFKFAAYINTTLIGANLTGADLRVADLDGALQLHFKADQ